MRRVMRAGVLPSLIAMYLPFCAAEVRPTVQPNDAPAATLWAEPVDLESRDLYHGPWGADRAPDPQERYTLIERKHTGVNPGMTVRDRRGREWSVKQPPSDDWPAEGPVEVVLSRILAAVGYHQPPVYYLETFTVVDEWGAHRVPGGRFRLKDNVLRDVGNWSWQRNPFVGSRAYQGLLVILMTLNSSDLKNSNNTIYEHRGETLVHWYVVRDLGTALGSTGRLAPTKNDPVAFERDRLVDRVENGFVRFAYDGWHQELVRRITTADVRWAIGLLDRLSDRQWADAFRAGGYAPAVAERFIRTIRRRVAHLSDLASQADAGRVSGRLLITPWGGPGASH